MSYINRNKKGQFRKQHGFTLPGFVFVVIILFSLFSMLYKRYMDGIELVSPAAFIATPVYAQENIKCEEPAGYIRCQYYRGVLTLEEATIMSAIAKAESNMNPNARNGRSTARGLFQIIAGTWYLYDCTGDKYNFKDNTQCAIKIMKSDKALGKSGFGQWEVFNNGAYKKHLKKVVI